MRLFSLLPAMAATLFSAGVAAAQEVGRDLPIIGIPEDGALGFQPAASQIAEEVHWLDGMLLVIITVITLFVLALIGICIVRYNRRANPTPGTFTHNTPVEVAWTLIPIVILIFIGSFSLPVLFNQQEIPEADVTIKATGYQWYWGYEYPDHEFGFDSFMLGAGENVLNDDVIAELEEYGYPPEAYKLATDTAVVVPTGQTVVVQVTAADVIHSWTIPAFGVKQDGIPGRLAELWFEVPEGQEGVYFGQCSELCGISHAYMPITVKAVTTEEYEAWLDQSIAEYGGTPRETDFASAE